MDLHYTRDPLDAIRRLYRFEEMPLTPVVEARMVAAIDGDLRNRRARAEHRYALEGYGLNDALFGDYVERFAVAKERG